MLQEDFLKYKAIVLNPYQFERRFKKPQTVINHRKLT
jgi:hypothetical protein